jgi:hypothetical protein
MSVHLKVAAPTSKPKVPDYRDFRGSDHRDKYPSLKPKGCGTLKKDNDYQKEISSQWPIAPAYNKGAYQVVPLSEICTAGRKA